MAYRVPGPCSITFNSLDLGRTKAGIIIRPNTSFVPITSDHHGAAPGTFIFGGKSCLVEIIGMSASLLKAANIWDGAIGQNVDNSAASIVGKLASAAAQALVITERDGTSIWSAAKAFAVDPTELGLKSVQEIQFPLTFMIIPVTGVLFQTIPSYI